MDRRSSPASRCRPHEMAFCSMAPRRAPADAASSMPCPQSPNATKSDACRRIASHRQSMQRVVVRPGNGDNENSLFQQRACVIGRGHAAYAALLGLAVVNPGLKGPGSDSFLICQNKLTLAPFFLSAIHPARI